MGQGLQINCDFCGEPVAAPGGLLFTPVVANPHVNKKQHICVQCSSRVSNLLDLTDTHQRGGGVYYSPPLSLTSWEVITRNLNPEEAQMLMRELKHPE